MQKRYTNGIKYLVLMINNPGEYFYSVKRANHVIELAENFCRISKGANAGKVVRLELWEKALLAAVFGFIDINGNRMCREALLIVGKKNGKSHYCFHCRLIFADRGRRTGTRNICSGDQKGSGKDHMDRSKKNG